MRRVYLPVVQADVADEIGARTIDVSGADGIGDAAGGDGGGEHDIEIGIDDGGGFDRRFVLRGMAAALLGTLTGCGMDVRRDVTETGPGGPDAGMGSGSSSIGVARCGNELCIDLAAPENAVLRNVDGALVITFESRKLLVVRVSTTAAAVLSAICTHTGCTVRYVAVSHDIRCPCHGSRFTIDGFVTRGPAAMPLAKLMATLDGQIIRVVV